MPPPISTLLNYICNIYIGIGLCSALSFKQFNMDPMIWTVNRKRKPFRGGRPKVQLKRRRTLYAPRTQTAVRLQRARNLGLKNIRTGGLLAIETKFLDVPRTALALTSPADASGGEINPSSIVTGCLSAPAQGDGPQNREGMKIAMKSILIKGAIVTTATNAIVAASETPSVFLALVLDTQTNAATLNSEDVFTNPCANTSGNIALQRNMSFTERFKVLKTKIINLEPQFFTDGTDACANSISRAFVLKKNLGGLQVKFTAGSTTADVANVVDNSLHLIAFCTDTTLAPNIIFNSRLRFVG